MKLLFLCISFVMFCGVALAETSKHKLFYIKRSTVDSIVMYEVTLENGELHSKEPIDVYWMTEEGRKNLGWLEKKLAFGVDVDEDSNEFTIAAFPERVIKIDTEDGAASALVIINDQEAILTDIYVDTSGSGLGTVVNYIKLSGYTTNNREKTSEIIVINKT